MKNSNKVENKTRTGISTKQEQETAQVNTSLGQWIKYGYLMIFHVNLTGVLFFLLGLSNTQKDYQISRSSCNISRHFQGL